MLYNTIPTVFTLLLFVGSFSIKSTIKDNTQSKTYSLKSNPHSNDALAVAYNSLRGGGKDLPAMESFAEAFAAYSSLKEKGAIKKEFLTIVDFSLSANTKRLWVIDMVTKEVKFHSLVSHGRNTGEEFATSFSNQAESYKSSLGLYVTAEVYSGKHGLSLKLDGLEKGVNDHARARGIVMHAADYVSESFIKNNHRLGRSQGCPAVPVEVSKEIINLIKGKSCFFIYHPSHSKVAVEKLMS